jgi:Flp pilus assembly protein TadD
MLTFFYDWDWQRAEHTFRQSITLNSNNAETLSYSVMFLAVGRVDEAIQLSKRALTLDPLAPLVSMNCGWTYFTVEMLAEASEQAAKMIESDPDFYGAHWLQGAIHLSEGEFKPAVEELRTAVSLGGITSSSRTSPRPTVSPAKRTKQPPFCVSYSSCGASTTCQPSAWRVCVGDRWSIVSKLWDTES